MKNEADTWHSIEVSIVENDGGLSHYLKRLYPSLSLEVWPLPNAIIIRGTVPDALTQQQIVEISKLFFAKIMNQLQIDSSVPLVKTNTLGIVPSSFIHQEKPIPAILDVSQKTLFLTSGSSQIVTFPDDIVSVESFDPDVMKVNPVGENPQQLMFFGHGGVTKVNVLLVNGTMIRLNLIFEKDVRHLQRMIHKLYPGVEVQIFPLKEAGLLRGTVPNRKMFDQIAELANQYFPHLLNHLRVAEVNALDLSNLQTGGSNQQSAPRITNGAVKHSSVKDVRSDIRALHDDVKELQNRQTVRP